MCELTGAAEGPASAVKIHQPPPQVALASRRGLVDAHGDASEGDVADLHSGQHLTAGGLLPQALQVVGGVPDGCDVVAVAQPSLEGGLRTDGRTGREEAERNKSSTSAKFLRFGTQLQLFPQGVTERDFTKTLQVQQRGAT